MSSFLHLLVVVLLLSWLSTAVFAANPIKPLLMLSNVYLPGEHHQTDFDISTFWVSEKLDGVRAYWDGTSLLTRSGHPIHAPKWFIDAFPSYALDGELWIGRGRFDEISSVIRKRFPNDPDWNNVQYMVFDLPESKEVFEHRYQALVKQVDELGVSWIKSVEQRKVESVDALDTLLIQIYEQGGEGLMLHHSNAIYQSGRSNRLLKYKLKQDDEAIVIGYTDGKGRNRGKVGALIVRSKEGKEFKVGSGLADDDRLNPPTIGSQITYQYSGYTKYGLPRFPSFVRTRDEM